MHRRLENRSYTLEDLVRIALIEAKDGIENHQEREDYSKAWDELKNAVKELYLYEFYTVEGIDGYVDLKFESPAFENFDDIEAEILISAVKLNEEPGPTYNVLDLFTVVEAAKQIQPFDIEFNPIKR